MDKRVEAAVAAARAEMEATATGYCYIRDEPNGRTCIDADVDLRAVVIAALAAADAVSPPISDEAAIRVDERRRLAKMMSANFDAVVLDVLEVAGELGGRCAAKHLANGLVLRGCSIGSAQVAIMSALDRRLIILHDDWTLEVAAPKPETKE